MALVACALIAGTLTGCGKKQQAPAAPPPAEVGVVTITATNVPMTTELPGRLDPVRTAEVRARVTGIVLKRAFEEGSEVKEGQLLFQIDPAPFQAAYDSAQASEARAEAGLAEAKAKADRYDALVKINAVSKQDYESAIAAAKQGQADVLAAQAAVETAKLNLGYASVTAPISGRIGAAKVTEGALVSQSAATLMATIQQLDPIYFDLVQSSTEMLRLRQEMEQGKLKSIAPGEAKVSLILEDGTIYSHPGKLLFSDVTVDPATGMITLRAEFPNPNHLLLPGMFARGRLEEAINTQAITVTQRAVQYGANGTASVLVVTPDNKVESRNVQIGRAIGGDWMVTAGLKPGERVIAEGLQKAQPGMTVKPVPFTLDTTNDVSGGKGAAQQ